MLLMTINDNMIQTESFHGFCMKCYVSEKEFLNFVKSHIFCQDHKLIDDIISFLACK